MNSQLAFCRQHFAVAVQNVQGLSNFIAVKPELIQVNEYDPAIRTGSYVVGKG